MKKIKRWKDKTAGEKARAIAGTITFLLFLSGTIVVFIFFNKIYGAKSIFNNSINQNAFVNWCWTHIPSLIGSIQVIVVSVALNHFIKMLMKLILSKTSKGLTIAQIFASFLKWALAIACILIILSLWGVDTTALIASAGILTLVVGLGAQSLIADIVAGIFIVFEEEYEVGDIIVLDGWRGTVVEVGIRTTKIQDAGGNIKIVNNSEIKAVINQTKQNSVAKCYMNINYEEDIDKVEEAIIPDLEGTKQQIKGLLTDIQYKGISEFSSAGVSLFFIARCKEPDIYQAQRDMNKILKKILESHGIYLAYQNLVVHNIKEKD